MNAKDYKKIIVGKLNEVLKVHAFKKKGNVFIYSNGDLTYFIDMQSSLSTSVEVLKVTINTGIASAMISKLDDTSLPVGQQRHYNRRIGSYLDGNQDKWWTVDSINAAAEAAYEITRLVINKVFPNFEELNSTEDLVTLWKNGGYIGITEGQRKKFLRLLEHAGR